MAVDAYMMFKPYKGDALQGESQVDFSKNKEQLASDAQKPGVVFEVETYGFGIEQTLNIGSQSKGSGAGKVTFEPFSITRKIDRASPTFFQMACSGTPFETVTLFMRKASGGDASGEVFLRFDFKLAAVKTISYEHDDESPKENVTFEYGGLLMRYTPQKADGTMDSVVPGGWNRVTNTSDQTTTAIPAS